jgi:PleD family two-component response regulator
MSELDSTKTVKKPLILVVDDDQMMREMLRDALAAAGYDTALAVDGESAVSSFTSLSPDLVMLDMVMPGTYPRLSDYQPGWRRFNPSCF